MRLSRGICRTESQIPENKHNMDRKPNFMSLGDCMTRAARLEQSNLVPIMRASTTIREILPRICAKRLRDILGIPSALPYISS